MTGRETWNKYASFFNAEEGTVFPHDLREMEFYRALRRSYDGDCLEIGAGSGRLARSLLQTGITVAVEPSDEMITQWSGADAGLAMRVQGFGEHLPFPDDLFQFVCFPYNGIQCVLNPSDRKSILNEAYRVTAPGGVFVLEVSPVFGRRDGEPLTERYCAELPDGRKLILRERVERCGGSGTIKYHMFYTVITGAGETTENVVLELAPVDVEDIRGNITEAGFTGLTLWGDYDRSGYDDDLSPRLLVKAEKRT